MSPFKRLSGKDSSFLGHCKCEEVGVMKTVLDTWDRQDRLDKY